MISFLKAWTSETEVIAWHRLGVCYPDGIAAIARRNEHLSTGSKKFCILHYTRYGCSRRSLLTTICRILINKRVFIISAKRNLGLTVLPNTGAY